MPTHRADAPYDVSAEIPITSEDECSPSTAARSQAAQDDCDWPGAIPVVMLRGKWLHRLGFPPRCMIRIEARKGVITLTPAGPRSKPMSLASDDFDSCPRFTDLKDPQATRAKLDGALRCRFREAAWQAGASPSLMLRLLMQRYVEIDEDRFGLSLPLWGYPERQAATLVVREMVAKKGAAKP